MSVEIHTNPFESCSIKCIHSQIYKVHYTTTVHYRPSPLLSILQLLMHNPLPSLNPRTQIRHRHNLHHQTRPTRKMLRALSGARLGIILLPRETRSFPLVVDIFHEVFAESGVDVGGLRFVGPALGCDVLFVVSSRYFRGLLEGKCSDLRRGFSRRGSSCLSTQDSSNNSRPSRRIRRFCSDSLFRIHSTAPRDR